MCLQTGFDKTPYFPNVDINSRIFSLGVFMKVACSTQMPLCLRGDGFNGGAGIEIFFF